MNIAIIFFLLIIRRANSACLLNNGEKQCEGVVYSYDKNIFFEPSQVECIVSYTWMIVNIQRICPKIETNIVCDIIDSQARFTYTLCSPENSLSKPVTLGVNRQDFQWSLRSSYITCKPHDKLWVYINTCQLHTTLDIPTYYYVIMLPILLLEIFCIITARTYLINIKFKELKHQLAHKETLDKYDSKVNFITTTTCVYIVISCLTCLYSIQKDVDELSIGVIVVAAMLFFVVIIMFDDIIKHKRRFIGSKEEVLTQIKMNF
jgi:hypothetical protein